MEVADSPVEILYTKILEEIYPDTEHCTSMYSTTHIQFLLCEL